VSIPPPALHGPLADSEQALARAQRTIAAVTPTLGSVGDEVLAVIGGTATGADAAMVSQLGAARHELAAAEAATAVALAAVRRVVVTP